MRLVALLAVFVAFVALATNWASAAEGPSALQQARAQIRAGQYKAALRALDQISTCNVHCRYTKAFAYSRLRDRPSTRRLAADLVIDSSAPTELREAAGRLLEWSNDERVTQKTGVRTVTRKRLGGYTLSDDNCSKDVWLLKAWDQEWQKLGVDPTQLYVPEGFRPCDVGPPIIDEETYADRCDLPARIDAEAVEAEATPATARDEQDDAADGWDGYDWGPISAPPPGPSEIVLPPRSPVLECSVFDPPPVALLE